MATNSLSLATSWPGASALACLAARQRSAHLHCTFRHATIDAWQAVNWLTHAQRATRAEAMICVASAHHAVSLVELAMCAPRLSDPAQCGRCGSRRLARVYHWSDDDSLKFTLTCDQCTWSSLEPQTETWQLGERIDDGDDSDCTTLEGFAETSPPPERPQCRLGACLQQPAHRQVGRRDQVLSLASRLVGRLAYVPVPLLPRGRFVLDTTGRRDRRPQRP
jgi:hypothetical protein